MSTVEGKKQEKRRALLDAAYELFLERGTSKTSVEDITSRAKVGKGTFYLYFADKGSVTLPSSTPPSLPASPTR